ncbi:MAG: hypothetical protein PHR77_20400 [Kiritimatiellae bacterium]|nr:hypothetical protein [Kiritimatiellia bacterium]MDD5521194.1 hypothetical protein [Kiritimatiellia bacterium]
MTRHNNDMRAHRFHAYWQNVEGRSVFTMPRAEWQSLGDSSGQPFEIDISTTPIAAVGKDAPLVAAVAQRYSTDTDAITICRYDDKDQPTPYNVDHYRVWKKLPQHRDFHKIVKASDTHAGPMLEEFMNENVFIVKDDPGPDHWLSEPPKVVEIVINKEMSQPSSACDSKTCGF